MWTFWRFLSIMVEARAVLKAVSSSALTMPKGLPVESSIVTDPFGVVLWALVRDAGGWNDKLSSLPEDIVNAGVKVNPAKSSLADLMEEDLVDVLPEGVDGEEDFLGVGASGCSSDTIFIPIEVPVEAGMKRVVMPRFLMTVRCGWKEEQHGELVSPVE